MLLLATPLAAAPLVTVEAIVVFVAGVDVTGGGSAAAVAGTGGDIGRDGGTTAAGVAVVVVTLAAAAIAEGDRHGDAATGGTTAAGVGATGVATTAEDTTGVDGSDGTGVDPFIDAAGDVEIAVVAAAAAEDVDDVVAGGIAGVDGVVAMGAVAFAAEAGAGDDADNDFAEAAEGSLQPLLTPPVARPPLNGMTGGANLRRGVSSVDDRVVVPPVDDTTPSTVPPPSPIFSVSCARWSSSTCRKRSSGTDSGRGPVSV